MPKGVDVLSSMESRRGKLTKLTPEERQVLWDRRMHIHRHNAMYGSTKMAMQNMSTIMNPRSSATYEAQLLAAKIWDDLWKLGDMLYEHRVEPDGTVVKPDHAGPR